MSSTFRSKALFKLAVAVFLASIGVVVVVSQGTPAKKLSSPGRQVSNAHDEVWFETNVGSFKILQKGPVFPSGDLTMSFTGSVLISELQGTVTPVGNVRREYNNPAKGRQVWFGTGKLNVKGSFRAVQWFGRDLKARFNGDGYIRLYGEFDKKLETGFYWFNPAEKKFWGNYGVGVEVPERKAGGAPVDIKTRGEFEKSKGGGKG